MSNNHYLDLFKEMGKNRRDYNDRLWATVKFITTIFIALVSVSLSLVSFLYINTNNDYKIIVNSAFNPLFLIPLMLISIALFVSCLGWGNFKRENDRLYEILAILNKIENKLGFHKKINNKKTNFPDDKYIIPDAWVEIKKGIKKDIRTTKDFRDAMFDRSTMRERGRFYFTFRWLFFVYIVISIILILFFAFLGFYQA